MCGSFHPRSANRSVLSHVESFLASAENVGSLQAVSAETIPALNPERFNLLPQPVADLRNQLAGAQAAVLAAPEYGGGLAGSFKNALDWCVGADNGFYGKPVLIASAGTSGGKNALEQLARTLLWQGAHLVGIVSISGPRGLSDKDGQINDNTTIEEIRQKTQALVDSLRLSPDARVELSYQQALSLGIRQYPHMPAPAESG